MVKGYGTAGPFGRALPARVRRCRGGVRARTADGGAPTARAGSADGNELSGRGAGDGPSARGPSDGSGAFDDDELFGVLRNQRRRRLLHHLREAGGEATLSDLARRVAAAENDKPVGAITGAERNRVYSSMRQVHLPALDDAGVVEFDRSRNEIRVAAGFEAVRPYLGGPGATAGEPWAVGCLLLAGVGSVLAGVAWVAGVGGWIGAAVLPLIALVALGHLARGRSSGSRLRDGTAVGE